LPHDHDQHLDEQHADLHDIQLDHDHGVELDANFDEHEHVDPDLDEFCNHIEQRG
jgi:hypothetical protein